MIENRSAVLPLVWLRGLALGFLVAKLLLLAVTPPFMDEAYYWLWGQHPGLSYFDHPPLNAWVLGASGTLFGWTLFALRLPVALALFGDLFVLWLFARRLSPQAPRETFWLTALLFLATPVFFGLTGLALPDHLLVFFGLASLYGFYRFLAGWGEGQGYGYLYLGALALGLAGLAKYNGVFIGIGFLAVVALTPAWRRLLLVPQLWAAMGLALLLQAPVLVWNIDNGFASFDFILAGRHGGLSDPAGWSGLTGFFLGMAGLLGPFLLLPLGRLLLDRSAPPPTGLARDVFWSSSLVVLAASVVTDVLFHWNLVAYIAVIPFLGHYLRERWVLISQLAYGALAAVLALVNYSVVPVMALISWTDQTTAWSYGWPLVAARVERVAAEHQAGFLAATDYTLASQLAFALRDDSVTSLSPKPEQFDFWFSPELHRGEDAVLLADAWRPLGPVQDDFASVELAEAVRVERFGRLVGDYSIYIARGYRGGGAEAAAP